MSDKNLGIDDILVSFAFTRDYDGLLMRFGVIEKETKKQISGIIMRLEEFLEPGNPFPIIPLKRFLVAINEPLAAVDKDNPWGLSVVEFMKKEPK